MREERQWRGEFFIFQKARKEREAPELEREEERRRAREEEERKEERKSGGEGRRGRRTDMRR